MSFIFVSESTSTFCDKQMNKLHIYINKQRMPYHVHNHFNTDQINMIKLIYVIEKLFAEKKSNIFSILELLVAFELRLK